MGRLRVVSQAQTFGGEQGAVEQGVAGDLLYRAQGRPAPRRDTMAWRTRGAKRSKTELLIRGTIVGQPISEEWSPSRTAGLKNRCYTDPSMSFEVVSEITQVELIAASNSIRDLRRLQKFYGPGRWRKMKGIAMVKLASGRVRRAELHWYEAHGIGRKELKRKRYLDTER